MLPLHRDTQQYASEKTAPDSAHAGLWYDRFFNAFLKGAKKPDEKNKQEKNAWAEGKSRWISSNSKKVGDVKKLRAFVMRQQALLEAYGGQALIMSNDWHFVTGLGNNHPVENGFAWHHTLGVPYLAGAAVKGLVRAWCEVWEGFDETKIRQWFGDTEQSGELIFFDAVPTAPVKLKADIMTPHYDKWYAEGESRPDQPDTTPADWHDPSPIPFLVVDKGARFRFAVARRTGSAIDMEQVSEALMNTLQYLGAGAKTSAGYGRMSEDPRVLASRRREQEERRKLEAARAREEAEARAREEAECAAREAEARRQAELAAMPGHERVMAEARERYARVQPRLAGHPEAYGELRAVINYVLDVASGWDKEAGIGAVDWVTSVLNEAGWRHPDFTASKRRKWEKRTRARLDELAEKLVRASGR